jgi:hypothetical protein
VQYVPKKIICKCKYSSYVIYLKNASCVGVPFGFGGCIMFDVDLVKYCYELPRTLTSESSTARWNLASLGGP